MPGVFSRLRLLAFYLSELPFDVNGALAGAQYRPFLRVRDMRSIGNLRAVDSGVWSGRRHHLASHGEYQIFKSLEGNAHILDIREQYLAASHEVLHAVLAGEEFSRNQVPTFDFVITLAPLERFGPLRYCVLSAKPLNLRETPGEIRRRKREIAFAERIGWSWSYINVPTDCEVRNNEKLAGWCYGRDIDDGYTMARDLAALFYRTGSDKALRGKLAMLAKRIHVAEEDQWFIFAAAYYFGFLRIDHARPLDEDGPLFLRAPLHG